MKKSVFVAGAAALVLGGCQMFDSTDAGALKEVKLGYDLSGVASNPEGFTLRDGSIYFSANNSTLNLSGSILRITPEGALQRVVNLPTHKDGTRIAALGIAWGPDNNLYVCDKQFDGTPAGKSCLWRVDFEGETPKQAVLLVRGFNHCNGVVIHSNDVYVTESFLKKEGDTTWGAVFKFSMAELAGMKPVREIEASTSDPHCLVAIPMQTGDNCPLSANGLDFDKDGNLFIASFGDAFIWKVGFKADGKVDYAKPFSNTRRQIGLLSIDGLHYDAASEQLFVADLLGNTVARVSAHSGRAHVIARNMVPHDAPDGNLDNPADIIRLGDKLYVANFNMAYGPHIASAYQSIGVIDWE